MARSDRHGKRADHDLLNDQRLRTLRRKTNDKLYYDKVLPDLILRNGKTQTWGLKKRPPGSNNPTWLPLGKVYVPAEGEKPIPAEISGVALTVAEARQKARIWLDMLDRGIDPRQEWRRQAKAGKRVKFPDLRDAYLKLHMAGKAKYREAELILGGKDFSHWGDRYADDIDAGDIEAAVQTIVDRGARSQARNSLSYIRAVYNWAKGRPSMRIKSSPCDGLSTKALVGKKKIRTRVLTDDELRAIWAACDDPRCLWPYGPIVKLLLLTGVREDQIGGMRWEEIADAERLLTVPSARMKGPDDDPPPPHEIPLSQMMLDIIEAMPRFAGPYVFSTSAGKRPVNGWSHAKERFDEISGVSQWIFHDLRRTVRTRLSAIPAEEHVREAVLAHGRRGIAAHYDQHKYRDEKRDLLERWEKVLLAIVNPPPSDVTDLADVRAQRAPG
jgi:integrase